MLTITLYDDTILRFNLKEPLKENVFRDAWYSMQDIPKAQENKLVIYTDKDISYRYKVNEIKDCVFANMTFLYNTPAVEKPRKARTNKIQPSAPASDGILNKISVNQDTFNQAINKVIEGLMLIFESIPDKYKMNLDIFMDKLKEQGLPLDAFSSEAMGVISDVMTGEEFQIDQYVEKYKELWHKFKKGN